MKLRIEGCAFCSWRYRENDRIACVNAEETVMICEPCVQWLREFIDDTKAQAGGVVTRSNRLRNVSREEDWK